VFENPKVPNGQVVIKVEGEEGGSGGEEEEGGLRRRRAEEGRGGRAGLVCVCSGRRTDPAPIHGIDIVWHHCSELGCEYKAKQKGQINQHRADVHDIGVTWHACAELGCEYKAKSESDLKKHKAAVTLTCTVLM